MRFRKRSYRRAYKSKKAYRRNKKAVPKAFRRYVKSYIARQAENKYTIVRAVNQTVSTAAGTTPYNYSMLPSLAVGANRYSRVGNKIRVRKLTVSGRINMLPYNAVSNPEASPIAVKIWVLMVNAYREIGAFSGSIASTGFFEESTGPTGFAGNVLDLITPVTSDFKVLASKTIYLGVTGATNNFPSTSVNAFDNSKFSAGYYFDVSKHIKSLRYNDTTSSSIPENKNCWVVIQPVTLSGSGASTAICENHYVINTQFEDM